MTLTAPKALRTSRIVTEAIDFLPAGERQRWFLFSPFLSLRVAAQPPRAADQLCKSWFGRCPESKSDYRRKAGFSGAGRPVWVKSGNPSPGSAAPAFIDMVAGPIPTGMVAIPGAKAE
jgi:hypothetical protein